MAEQVTTAKRRGRPRKIVEFETVLVINDTDRPESPQPKTKRSSPKKSLLSPETSTPSRKRVTTKLVTSSSEVDDVVKLKKPRKSAKDVDVRASSTSQISKDNDGVDYISKAISASSSILEQAIAFEEIREAASSSVSDSKSTSYPEVDTSDLISEREVLESNETQASEAATTTIFQKTLHTIRGQADNLASNFRQLSIERLNLSLVRATNNNQQLSNLIQALITDFQKRRAFALQLTNIGQRIDSFEVDVLALSSSIQDAIRDQRNSRLRVLDRELKVLTGHLSVTSDEIKDLLVAQARSKLIQQASYSLESLSTRVTAVASSVQQHQSITEPQPQLAASYLPTQSTSTTTITLDTQLSQQSKPPTSILTEQSLSSSQSILDHKMPTTSPSLFSQIGPKPVSISSSSPLPPQQQSTTSRTISHSTPVKKPTTPPSQPQPQPQPPPQQPRPLRPTELPYDKLRQDPRFKSQSRRWTGIIVGIPVVIATSWILYKRYQDTLFTRMSEEAQRGRQRSQIPSNPESRDIGVDRKRSNVGVNGGV